MSNGEVQLLQIKLKALGHYKGLIDGQYGPSTQNAVATFQTSKGLARKDGIADIKTQELLTKSFSQQTELKTSPVPTAAVTNPPVTPTQADVTSEINQKNLILSSILGLGILANIGAMLYLGKRFRTVPNAEILATQKLLGSHTEKNDKFLLKPAASSLTAIPTEIVPPEINILSSQMSVCEELMKELQCDNYKIRRKAIWKLAQNGDSRAVQPLVDLMLDADSEQQGLILSTLAEIGTRTLNPMNRALAISIRDENPQVRKNAIRDLVRMYDVIGKMSKIVLYAVEDPDPEVQETAKYALNQMSRLRTIPEQHILTEMNPEE
jgi:hypothetical protein